MSESFEPKKFNFETQIIGRTSQGRTLDVLYPGRASKNQNIEILVMSGLHGDEVEGVILNKMIFQELTSLEVSRNQGLNSKANAPKIAFLPVANPDGFALFQRWTSQHVDLNRNWATKDFTPKFTNPRYPPGPHAESEPETRALREYIDTTKPKIIVDLHSYQDAIVLPHYAGRDQTLEAHVEKLASDLGLSLDTNPHALGYEITGGFHTWCYEHGIHSITIEVKKGLGQHDIRATYLKGSVSFIEAIRG